MIKFYLKIILPAILISTISSCSKDLQTVELQVSTEDTSFQESFDVVSKTLTIAEAKKQNESAYKRIILQSGRGENARSVPESSVLISNFPQSEELYEYKIGIGDKLLFSRLIENNTSGFLINARWPKQHKSFAYKLGIGDTVELKLLREENKPKQSLPKEEDNSNLASVDSNEEVTITSSGRIGSDGSLLLWRAALKLTVKH